MKVTVSIDMAIPTASHRGPLDYDFDSMKSWLETVIFRHEYTVEDIDDGEQFIVEPIEGTITVSQRIG